MLYIEIVLILAIIGLQLVLYIRNRRAAADLAGLYPLRQHIKVSQLQVNPNVAEDSGSYQVDQLNAEQTTHAFQEMLNDTNTYLQKNKGSASFNILKDLAERPFELQTAAAGASISTPLYVGLLGTFLGIGIGVGGHCAGRGKRRQHPNFLAGVLVAMAGSFCGLLFTLLSNFNFRQAQQQAKVRQQAYFSFIQAQLLPRLQQDMADSLNNLRGVLDQFNSDFFQKIIDFKDVFGNLSQYITVQERFLAILGSMRLFPPYRGQPALSGADQGKCLPFRSLWRLPEKA